MCSANDAFYALHTSNETTSAKYVTFQRSTNRLAFIESSFLCETLLCTRFPQLQSEYADPAATSSAAAASAAYDIPPDAEEEQYSAIKLLPPAHTVVDLETGTDTGPTSVFVTEEQDAANGYIPMEAEGSFSRAQGQAYGDGNTLCCTPEYCIVSSYYLELHELS